MYNYAEQPRSAGPRMGDWLSEAFTLFGQQAGVWCLQGLVAYLLTVLPAVVVVIALFSSMIATLPRSPGPSSGPPLGLIFGFYAAIIPLSLVLNLIQIFMHAGMVKTAAKQLRGEPITVGDVFSGGSVFIPVLVERFLGGVAQFVGAMFCLVPAYLLGGLFFLGTPIVVEERVSGTTAIGRSWDIAKPHLWMYALWFFVINLIAQLGFMVFGLGYPLLAIAEMLAYRDEIGLPGALPPPGAYGATPPLQQRSYGPAGAPMTGYTCPVCHRQLAAGAVICPFCETRFS